MRRFGRLREEIKNKFQTEKVFADAVGIDSSTLSLKLNGKVGWKQAEIEKVCKLLDIPIERVHEYFFYN